MSESSGVSRWVLVRDLIIFQFKLSIDTAKTFLLAPLTTFAAIFGIVFGGRERGKTFYALMNVGERLDLWLNLYGSSKKAWRNEDGLLGATEPGSDNMLGRLEVELRSGSRRASLPRPPAQTPPTHEIPPEIEAELSAASAHL